MSKLMLLKCPPRQLIFHQLALHQKILHFMNPYYQRKKIENRKRHYRLDTIEGTKALVENALCQAEVKVRNLKGGRRGIKSENDICVSCKRRKRRKHVKRHHLL